MQQLQFESSWDKQLAPQDRRNIEKIFQETKSLNSTSVIFSPIREAINHKDALLVSVLVHNFTKNQPYLAPITLLNTSTMKPITAEQRPPIKALFNGMDDLMVRLNATQMENRM